MAKRGREADCDEPPPSPNPGGGPLPHYRRGGRAKKHVGADGEKARRRLDRPGRARGGRTVPSGGVSAAYRHRAEAKGHTMPGGSFPINDAEDLRKAKHDVGRARNPAAARAWINKRARQLGEPELGESD